MPRDITGPVTEVTEVSEVSPLEFIKYVQDKNKRVAAALRKKATEARIMTAKAKFLVGFLS